MDNKQGNSVFIYRHDKQGGGYIYDIYIEEFNDYRYYIEAFNILRSATELDTINFIINSPGGYIDILSSFLYCIDITQAQEVNAELAGEACSAAAILALACDNLYVNPNSRMLIHSISHGVVGKVYDNIQHIENTKSYQELLAERYYKQFLTDDEIEEVLKGKEFWIGSDEIMKRWEKVIEKRMKEIEQHQAEQEEQNLNALIDFLKEQGYNVTKKRKQK